jgi:hypothetical protein
MLPVPITAWRAMAARKESARLPSLHSRVQRSSTLSGVIAPDMSWNINLARAHMIRLAIVQQRS